MSIELCSVDNRFGIHLPDETFVKIQTMCVNARNHETGGILIGHYDVGHRLAYVTDATGPPRDSKMGRYWFARGVHGISRLLKRRWESNPRSYYLGEWHYHPSESSAPSNDDRKQMNGISNASSYMCPEPILLIVPNPPEPDNVHCEVTISSGDVFVLR